MKGWENTIYSEASTSEFPGFTYLVKPEPNRSVDFRLPLLVNGDGSETLCEEIEEPGDTVSSRSSQRMPRLEKSFRRSNSICKKNKISNCNCHIRRTKHTARPHRSSTFLVHTDKAVQRWSSDFSTSRPRLCWVKVQTEFLARKLRLHRKELRTERK